MRIFEELAKEPVWSTIAVAAQRVAYFKSERKRQIAPTCFPGGAIVMLSM